MTRAHPTAAAEPLANTPVANTAFRLGEEQHFSDGSDSDQSQRSQRSFSPTQTTGRPPKSRKRKQKDRHQMRALADELVGVLGDVFSAPNARSQADKRTRQNLARMQARKEKNGARRTGESSDDYVLRTQTAAAERRGMTLEDYRKLRSRGSGREKGAAAVRRSKKKAARTKQAAAGEDKMDIE
ncbi:hypothetical protein BDW02DRAFT_366243 [Decorospora gaudefroyi]|uniref:Uncharacterized protein n=1 Tax=Decorospora gaudefroyi TaxID=184978 RepID=A0A6A5KUP5_9PLEO|nr:hypothetical protein BDW02DRAFT_366243 [Decorospora gaudefroyi]